MPLIPTGKQHIGMVAELQDQSEGFSVPFKRLSRWTEHLPDGTKGVLK